MFTFYLHKLHCSLLYYAVSYTSSLHLYFYSIGSVSVKNKLIKDITSYKLSRSRQNVPIIDILRQLSRRVTALHKSVRGLKHLCSLQVCTDVYTLLMSWQVTLEKLHTISPLSLFHSPCFSISWLTPSRKFNFTGYSQTISSCPQL